MLHLEHLVMPGEDDLVLADDGAAADGGDAYLLAPSRLPDTVPLEGTIAYPQLELPFSWIGSTV